VTNRDETAAACLSPVHHSLIHSLMYVPAPWYVPPWWWRQDDNTSSSSRWVSDRL